jgi:hypothetical protein
MWRVLVIVAGLEDAETLVWEGVSRFVVWEPWTEWSTRCLWRQVAWAWVEAQEEVRQLGL